LVDCFDDRYSCVASNSFVVDKDKRLEKMYSKSRVVYKKDLFWSNCLGNQVLVPRKYVIGVGGFDEQLVASQDKDLWLRLIDEYGPAKRIKDVLYYMDAGHEYEQITFSNSRIIGTRQFIEKYGREMSSSQLRYNQYLLFLQGDSGTDERDKIIRRLKCGLRSYGFSIRRKFGFI